MARYLTADPSRDSGSGASMAFNDETCALPISMITIYGAYNTPTLVATKILITEQQSRAGRWKNREKRIRF